MHDAFIWRTRIRRFAVHALFVLQIVAGWSPIASARPETIVMANARPGSARVTISDPYSDGSRVAYIVDGGQGSAARHGALMVEGTPLLRHLLDSNVNKLVVVCSHPHEDHQGGLVEIIRNDPLFAEFSVYVRDSGLTDSLRMEVMSRMPEWADIPGEARRYEAALDETGNIRDVLASLSAPGVRIRNLEYRPESVHAHGCALVTIEEHAAAGGRPSLLVDTDDAEGWVIDLLEQWLEQHTDGELHIIGPHHGSAHNDISGLLRLRERIRSWIIPVNERNRFGHPAPSVIRRILEVVPPDRIYITGQGSVIVRDGVVTGVSIQDQPTAFIRNFISRQADVFTAERDLIRAAERTFLDRLPPARRRRLEWIENELAAVDHLRDRFDPPPPFVVRAPVPPHWPPRGGPGSPSARFVSDQRWRLTTEELDERSDQEAGQPSRARRLQRGQSGREGVPVPGGVLVAGDVDLARSHRPTSVAVDVAGESVTIRVQARSPAGLPVTGAFQCSRTELWAAATFTASSEVALISMSGSEAVHVAVHPAVRDTALGLELARLDAFVLACRSRIEAGLDPAFEDQVRVHELSDWLFESDSWGLQWFDRPTFVTIENGAIDVLPCTIGQTSCLQLRFWHDGMGEEQAEKEGQVDTDEVVSLVEANLDSFRLVERFAQLVIMLRWLQDAKVRLELPPDLDPALIEYSGIQMTVEDLFPEWHSERTPRWMMEPVP